MITIDEILEICNLDLEITDAMKKISFENLRVTAYKCSTIYQPPKYSFLGKVNLEDKTLDAVLVLDMKKLVIYYTTEQFIDGKRITGGCMWDKEGKKYPQYFDAFKMLI